MNQKKEIKQKNNILIINETGDINKIEPTKEVKKHKRKKKRIFFM